jgi:hypothetical protein
VGIRQVRGGRGQRAPSPGNREGDPIKWTDRAPGRNLRGEIGNFALTPSGASRAVLLSGVLESDRFLNQTIKVEAASEGVTTRCANHTFSDTHDLATIELS